MHSTTRPEPEYEKLWFPTPENCHEPEILPKLQKRTFYSIQELMDLIRWIYQIQMIKNKSMSNLIGMKRH